MNRTPNERGLVVMFSRERRLAHPEPRTRIRLAFGRRLLFDVRRAQLLAAQNGKRLASHTDWSGSNSLRSEAGRGHFHFPANAEPGPEQATDLRTDRFEIRSPLGGKSRRRKRFYPGAPPIGSLKHAPTAIERQRVGSGSRQGGELIDARFESTIARDGQRAIREPTAHAAVGQRHPIEPQPILRLLTRSGKVDRLWRNRDESAGLCVEEAGARAANQRHRAASHLRYPADDRRRLVSGFRVRGRRRLD